MEQTQQNNISLSDMELSDDEDNILLGNFSDDEVMEESKSDVNVLSLTDFSKEKSEKIKNILKNNIFNPTFIDYCNTTK